MKTATLEWLKAGTLDLKTMEKLIDDEFLTCMVAFHAQQLTEKAFVHPVLRIPGNSMIFPVGSMRQ